MNLIWTIVKFIFTILLSVFTIIFPGISKTVPKEKLSITTTANTEATKDYIRITNDQLYEYCGKCTITSEEVSGDNVIYYVDTYEIVGDMKFQYIDDPDNFRGLETVVQEGRMPRNLLKEAVYCDKKGNFIRIEFLSQTYDPGEFRIIKTGIRPWPKADDYSTIPEDTQPPYTPPVETYPEYTIPNPETEPFPSTDSETSPGY